MKILLILGMLACAPGFAQSGKGAAAPARKNTPAPAPAVTRFPIESLTVEGNRNFTRDQVLAVAGLRPGQTAGKADFDRARDRLVACGAFENVSYRFAPGPSGGYAAIFQVSEVQQVYPVVFEDLHVSTLDLQAALRAKDPLFTPEKLPATQPVIERYVKWIQEFLATKGITEKIAGTVAPGSPGDYNVVFRPARNLPAVAQISFEGNHVISQTVLREAVSGSAVGSPYTEDNFRQILNSSIRPLYETRGRVRVAFPKLRTEPAKDVEGLHVYVTVDEGESFSLGKVAIEGTTPVAAETLLKAGDFKTGDVANMERVNEGLERIRKVFHRAGYMQAKVAMTRKVDDSTKAVDVAVQVDPGPEYTMGKLTLVGLDLDGEAELKRIWTLKIGKPFNPEYPEAFLKRIHDEGLFDNLGQTKSEVRVNDRDLTVDVTLNFKGQNPASQPGRRRNTGHD